MKTFFIQNPLEISSVAETLDTCDLDPEIKSILILSCDKDHTPKADIDLILKRLNKPVFGGLFPELIYQGERKQSGMIVVGLYKETKTLLFEGKNSEEQIYELISEKFTDDNPEGKSIFLFTDALHFNKTGLIDSLYNYFGMFPAYIGGGAGSLSFENIPSIYSNEGLVRESAIIGLYDGSISIGVDHGYKAISDSFKVTESVNNQIISLNWKPAMEVYQYVVEKHSGKLFKKSEFGDFVKSYPFGINKVDSQMVVRDPFMEKDGSIFTLDAVEQGSYINIVYAKEQNLVDGAGLAKEYAQNNVRNQNSGSIFVIDCITRSLFLDENFHKELNALDPENVAFGALTLGEIANFGNSYLEIYNKTAVVGIFEND
jgi:hypothetical protein